MSYDKFSIQFIYYVCVLKALFSFLFLNFPLAINVGLSFWNSCWCRNGQYWWEDHRPPSGVWKGTHGGEAISFSGCDDHQTSADTSVILLCLPLDFQEEWLLVIIKSSFFYLYITMQIIERKIAHLTTSICKCLQLLKPLPKDQKWYLEQFGQWSFPAFLFSFNNDAIFINIVVWEKK